MSKQNLSAAESTDFAKLKHPVLIQRCEQLDRQNKKIREANHMLTQNIEFEEARNQKLLKRCAEVAENSNQLLQIISKEYGITLEPQSQLLRLRDSIQRAQGPKQ